MSRIRDPYSTETSSSLPSCRMRLGATALGGGAECRGSHRPPPGIAHRRPYQSRAVGDNQNIQPKARREPLRRISSGTKLASFRSEATAEEPMVCGLSAGGRRIRTLGPSSDGEHDSALILSSPPRRCASPRLRARRLIRRCSRDAICSARGYSALQCGANSSGVVLSAPPQFSSETIGRSSSNRPRHRNAGVVECR